MFGSDITEPFSLDQVDHGAFTLSCRDVEDLLAEHSPRSVAGATSSRPCLAHQRCSRADETE
jgi:hypothetical protein